MRKVHILGLVLLVFFTFGCVLVAEEIQSTETTKASPTVKPTKITKPTQTAEPIVSPTSTPPLMDTRSVYSVLSDGFIYANKEYGEKMQVLSVNYEGGNENNPLFLLLKVRDNSEEYQSGCLTPLAILSYGVLRNNSREVFPATLESLRVDCYTSDSHLLLSYRVTFASLENFASANNIDVNQLEVISSNLPASTPRTTNTPVPTHTQSPIPIQPTAPSANCSPAYPDVCIAPPPPDLDCGDIPFKRFKVLPPDPHKFDRDGDGIGCES